jgi:hypothetical protein
MDNVDKTLMGLLTMLGTIGDLQEQRRGEAEVSTKWRHEAEKALQRADQAEEKLKHRQAHIDHLEALVKDLQMQVNICLPPAYKEKKNEIE